MDNDMFNNMINNSIGAEKRCKKDFKIKKVVMKLALPIIIGIVMATSLTGCFFNQTPSKVDVAVSEMADISQNYPFDLGDVRIYEKARLYNLLDEKGITKYDGQYGLRDYDCTVDDYKMIPELDESYLYSMYSFSSEEDANILAQALGYSSLDDYLIKNGFVDSDGKQSIRYWGAVDAVQMAEKINAELNEKGVVK